MSSHHCNGEGYFICSNTAGTNCRGDGPLGRASNRLLKIPISSVDRVVAEAVPKAADARRAHRCFDGPPGSRTTRQGDHQPRPSRARFSITPQTIDDTLNDAYSQRQVAHYFKPPRVGTESGQSSATPVGGSEMVGAQQLRASEFPHFYLRSPCLSQRYAFARSIRCRARKTVRSPASTSADIVHRRKATLTGSMRSADQKVSSPIRCCLAWQALHNGTA